MTSISFLYDSLGDVTRSPEHMIRRAHGSHMFWWQACRHRGKYSGVMTETKGVTVEPTLGWRIPILVQVSTRQKLGEKTLYYNEL